MCYVKVMVGVLLILTTIALTDDAAWAFPQIEPPPDFCEAVAPTGQPITIVLQEVTINGQPADSGDIVCVLDSGQDWLAVGSGTVAPDQTTIATVWKEDPDYGLPGAICGNPIAYRVYDDSEDLAYEGWQAEYSIGDSLFCGEPYTALTIDFFASVPAFCPVVEPTGQPLTFVICDIRVEGEHADADDILCILDETSDNLPVGSKVLDGSFPELVTAWEEDLELTLPGAGIGHTITYQFYDASEDSCYDSPSNWYYFHGDSLFGGEPFTHLVLFFGDTTDVEHIEQPDLHASIHGVQYNPTNGLTRIEYALESASVTGLDIYDVQGRRVALIVSGFRESGTHTATWAGRLDHGERASPGVYFAVLRTSDTQVSKKFIRY